MRSTMNLDDALYARAKQIAATTGQTVTSVIEDAMRVQFAHLDDPPPWSGLPVSRQAGGPRPGVDLHDGRALRALLDDGVATDALR